MRVSVICGADLVNDKLATRTCDVLTEKLRSTEAIALTDENPDIVHIIGAWNIPTIAAAKSAQQRNIPYIHTPLGSLAPWNKPTASQQRLSTAAAAVVASGIMEQKLFDKQNSDSIIVILNPVITTLTTAEKMAHDYLAIYKQYIQSSDDSIQQSIDSAMNMLNESDENIVTLCRQLLLAQHLYRKRNIPQQLLNNLTTLLLHCDYDEEHAAEILTLISLYNFTRRLEYVLQEQTALTEGFMPIPLLADKEAKAMLKTVTNYIQ